MLCYRDRTYCGSKVHKPDCNRQFVPDEAYWSWSRELRMPGGGPVAYADFCSTGFKYGMTCPQCKTKGIELKDGLCGDCRWKKGIR